MDEATRPRIVLADTTPLFGAYSPSDQYHDRAQDDLRRLERERIPVGVLSTTVIETHTMVLYRQGTTAARNWLNAITSASTPIHPTRDDFKTAISHLSRFEDQRLTIFDTLIFVVSNRLNVPVWSYDHHFDVLRASRWY